MNIFDIGSVDNDGNGDNLRAAFRKVNTMHAVISRVMNIPGSPALGNLYIVPSGATGAWASQERRLAWYDGFTWEFYTPTEGVRAWVSDEDLLIVYSGSAWVEPKRAYDMRIGFNATPTSSKVLDTIVVPREVMLPANMAGSVGVIRTNPTSSFSIDVQDDAVSIGTITIATNGNYTFTTTSGTAKTIDAGSVLTFIAPGTVDATAAGASITIAGRA